MAILASILTSMGAVSLPGQVRFVISIAPISLAVGIPVAPLGLLVAVETLPDIFRTLGNAQTDVAVATAVHAQSHRGGLPAQDTSAVGQALRNERASRPPDARPEKAVRLTGLPARLCHL